LNQKVIVRLEENIPNIKIRIAINLKNRKEVIPINALGYKRVPTKITPIREFWKINKKRFSETRKLNFNMIII
jgi:hypothetical protein